MKRNREVILEVLAVKIKSLQDAYSIILSMPESVFELIDSVLNKEEPKVEKRISLDLGAFPNLIELQQDLDTEEKCRKYLEQKRWGGKVTCPHCKSENVCRFRNGRIFKCRNSQCRGKFSVTVGTIYENTKIPLRKWIHAEYELIKSSGSMPTTEMAKQLHITQKTAWFMKNKIIKN